MWRPGQNEDPARWSLQATVRVLFVLTCALTQGSCVNDGITASRSSSILVIERIGAARGGTNDDPIRTLLQSDVTTNGWVFDDIGRDASR